MTTSQTVLPAYHHRKGQGPTLVFLPYWGGTSRTWAGVLEVLAGRDVLAIDPRGWGRSQRLPGPYGLARLAEDVRAVMAEAGVGEYVLVGHSMGGKVAQWIAADRPGMLRGLVLVAPAPARPHPGVTPEYQSTLAHAYDSAASVAEVRDRVLTGRVLTGSLAEQVVADSLSAGDEARREWPRRGIAADITRRTVAIEVPVLVVTGEADQVEPAGVLREYLLPYLPEDTRTVQLAGVGHLIPLEAPAELAAALSEFVDSSLAEASRSSNTRKVRLERTPGKA